MPEDVEVLLKLDFAEGVDCKLMCAEGGPVAAVSPPYLRFLPAWEERTRAGQVGKAGGARTQAQSVYSL